MYVSGCHQRLTRLRYVTPPLTNLHSMRLYCHFLIQYEFYTAAQIQTIILIEQMLHGHTW